MKILYFDDNADGEAHLTGVSHDISDPHILHLIPSLQWHDHIIITDDDIYYRYGDSPFTTYAPYGIIIEMGDKVNVNKL